MSSTPFSTEKKVIEDKQAPQSILPSTVYHPTKENILEIMALRRESSVDHALTLEVSKRESLVYPGTNTFGQKNSYVDWDNSDNADTKKNLDQISDTQKPIDYRGEPKYPNNTNKTFPHLTKPTIHASVPTTKKAPNGVISINEEEKNQQEEISLAKMEVETIEYNYSRAEQLHLHLANQLESTEALFKKHKQVFDALLLNPLKCSEEEYLRTSNQLHSAFIQLKNLSIRLEKAKINFEQHKQSYVATKHSFAKLKLKFTAKELERVACQANEDGMTNNSSSNFKNIYKTYLKDCQCWFRESTTIETQLKQHFIVKSLLDDLRFLEWVAKEVAIKVNKEPDNLLYPITLKVLREDYEYKLKIWVFEYTKLVQAIMSLIDRKNNLLTKGNTLNESMKGNEQLQKEYQMLENTAYLISEQSNVLNQLIQDPSQIVLPLTESQILYTLGNPLKAIEIKGISDRLPNAQTPLEPPLPSPNTLANTNPHRYSMVSINLDILRSQYKEEILEQQNQFLPLQSLSQSKQPPLSRPLPLAPATTPKNN